MANLFYRSYKTDDSALKDFTSNYGIYPGTHICFGSSGSEYKPYSQGYKFYFGMALYPGYPEKMEEEFNSIFKNIKVNLVHNYPVYKIRYMGAYGYDSSWRSKKTESDIVIDEREYSFWRIDFSNDYDEFSKFALIVTIGEWFRICNPEYNIYGAESIKENFFETALKLCPAYATFSYIKTSIDKLITIDNPEVMNRLFNKNYKQYVVLNEVTSYWMEEGIMIPPTPVVILVHKYLKGLEK